jgi:hypothetical protein
MTIEFYGREYDVAELIEDQKLLRALEYAGVDNWEGYAEALDFLNQENSND